MSFGFSISDVTSLIQLTVRTYRGWKKACGEYSRITGELETLEVILSRVEFEVQQPTSLLIHHDRDLSKLQKIVSGCKDVVKDLEKVISKFQSLGFSRRNNWDRLRLGNKDLSGLQQRLGLQITALGTYLSVLGISSVGRVEESVKVLPEMKRTIDNLAAEIRAGRREGSVMTTYENDKKEVWRQFRRELISEGIQSEKIDMVKRHLRCYIKKLDEAGLLDEEVPEELEDSREMLREAQIVRGESDCADPQAACPVQARVESDSSESEDKVHHVRSQGKEPVQRPNDHQHETIPLRPLGSDAAIGDSLTSRSPPPDYKSPNTSPPPFHKRLPFDRPEVPRQIEYQSKPLSSFYPTIQPDLALPAGWYRLLDPENNIFYVDMCSSKGNKKCFWKPPMPEEYPHLPPPFGWQRVETRYGRIFWLHLDTGLRSYQYPTKNNLIIFKDGEPTHVFVEGFTEPQHVSLLAKHQLVPRDEGPRPEEGLACQISRKVWEDGLSEDKWSEVGHWQIYLITSNVVIMGNHNAYGLCQFKLYQSGLPSRQVNSEQHPHQLPVPCTLHAKPEWVHQAQNFLSRGILEQAFGHEFGSKDGIPDAWICRERLLTYPFSGGLGYSDISAEEFIQQLRSQINICRDWEPFYLYSYQSAFTLESFVRYRMSSAACIRGQLRTELGVAMRMFCTAWTRTALRFGPPGKLYRSFAFFRDKLELPRPISFFDIIKLDTTILLLPGDWHGTDLCSRRLLYLREVLLRARRWFEDEDEWQMTIFRYKLRFFRAIVEHIGEHLREHCGTPGVVERLNSLNIEHYARIIHGDHALPCALQLPASATEISE